MRHMYLAALGTLCLLLTSFHIPKDSPLELDVEHASASDNATSRTTRKQDKALQALVSLATYKQRLEEACEAFLISDATSEDLSALLTVAGSHRDPAAVFVRCGLDEDDVEDLLMGVLSDRIEEGDRDASRIAFALAGTQCSQTPLQIDRECEDAADELEWPVTRWRTCIKDGYSSYKQCSLDVLTEHGVNATKVDDAYFGRYAKQTSDLVHAAKDGSADPHEVVDELMRRAEDRVLIETMSTGAMGASSYMIFALSQNLKFQGETQLQEEMQPLLDFWIHRCDLDQTGALNDQDVEDIQLAYND